MSEKERLRRVLEDATVGLSIVDITARLRAAGIEDADEDQVRADIESFAATDYIQELLRKQFLDITLADTETRLKSREKIISLILDQGPTKKTEIEPVYPKDALPQARRIPIIAQGIIDGLSQTEIARRTGVSIRTNYKDRQTLAFETLFNTMFERHLQDLAEYALSGEQGAQKFVLAQRTSILRAMMPRRAEVKAEIVQVVIEPEWDPRIANRRKFVESDQQDNNDNTEKKS